MRFAVGDRVHSRKVGARDAFDGEIVDYRPESGRTSRYDESWEVKDTAGVVWNRGEKDLSPVLVEEGVA